jgi:hypothetical protein
MLEAMGIGSSFSAESKDSEREDDMCIYCVCLIAGLAIVSYCFFREIKRCLPGPFRRRNKKIFLGAH